MKKTRLLVAMLVMLVSASSYAQDSYRQVVKDYLTAVSQFDKDKVGILALSEIFDKNGQVDIDQLTKRYFDERYEDDVIDFYVTSMTEQGMTEADLRELSSLVSTPEFKVFSDHTKNWAMGIASEMMGPLMGMMDFDEKAGIDSREYLDKVSNYVSILDSPVQPNPEIDAAYAEKFNHVMLKSPVMKLLNDIMLKRFEQKETPDDPGRQESDTKVKDWMTKNLPVLLLNHAYGNLTPEDLDYASHLFANEAYFKLSNFDLNNIDMESLKAKQVNSKYLEWMLAQGAKLTEDPKAIMGMFKSLFESYESQTDDITKED